MPEILSIMMPEILSIMNSMHLSKSIFTALLFIQCLDFDESWLVSNMANLRENACFARFDNTFHFLIYHRSCDVLLYYPALTCMHLYDQVVLHVIICIKLLWVHVPLCKASIHHIISNLWDVKGRNWETCTLWQFWKMLYRID